MNHTTGKWRTGRKVGRTIYADDKLIGVTDRAEDARLAAAAPQLLEACKKAVMELEAHGYKYEVYGLAMMRAAIAKAE